VAVRKGGTEVDVLRKGSCFGEIGFDLGAFVPSYGMAEHTLAIAFSRGVPTDRVRFRGRPPWDYEDYLESDPEFLNRYLEGQTRPTGEVHVRVIQNPILFTVSSEDGKNGLITGLGGVVLRTSNGGESWVYRRIERKQAVFSVGLATGRTVAVGEKGLVRISTDQGNSWAPPEPENCPSVFTYMRDIDFTSDGANGFIVGQSGRVLRSRDAGFSWEQVLPPPSQAEG